MVRLLLRRHQLLDWRHPVSRISTLAQDGRNIQASDEDGRYPSRATLLTESAMTNRYIPALGFKALTPYYDTFVGLTTRESTVKQALINAACAGAPDIVVDIGCGTGTLAVGIKRRWPQTQVIGVDLDDQMLGYARAKTVDADLSVEFIKADAANLPLPDGLADRVVSSLFFHHLLPTQKRQALTEALRVLAPGGELYVADWGRPGNWLMRALFFPVRLLDGFANTADHVRGRLPALIREAGAEHVTPIAEFSTLFGTLTLLRAVKPER